MYQTFSESPAERLVDLFIMIYLLCTKPDGNMNMPEVSAIVGFFAGQKEIE